MSGKAALFALSLLLFVETARLTQRHFHPQFIYRFRNVSIHMDRTVQKQIVRHHNRFRSMVQPPASNMLKMKWNKRAARDAQKWADQCMFLEHPNATERHDRHFGTCGQNIFLSTRPVPWLFAIKTWFSEKQHFAYGRNTNSLKLVGHYTQMVWATTQVVGCGIRKCNKNSKFDQSTYYNYVCNYCPIGNIGGKIGTPYKAGKSCGDCQHSCKNKLCSNGCHFFNTISNCDSLQHRHSKRLICSELGKQCKATCRCRNKIYEH